MMGSFGGKGGGMTFGGEPPRGTTSASRWPRGVQKVKYWARARDRVRRFFRRRMEEGHARFAQTGFLL